jgi:hypothetical protein
MKNSPRHIFPLLLCLSMLPAVASAKSLRHLFLDPAFLEQSDNVALHVNPPQQREVVIRPDKPWELLMISLFLTVLDDGGKLRMWYICRDKKNVPNVAYAESNDGVNWIKPNLGIVEYDATRGGIGGQITELTDSSGGTASDTIADVPGAYAEATLANQIASLAAKINAIIRQLG